MPGETTIALLHTEQQKLPYRLPTLNMSVCARVRQRVALCNTLNSIIVNFFIVYAKMIN